ncbi:E3 ubiquitin-protein ligase ATL42-like [Nymphaea colorata]|nr:E3 ubiquitin-protein ligase ATL42-like [Nymphaea colorata]
MGPSSPLLFCFFFSFVAFSLASEPSQETERGSKLTTFFLLFFLVLIALILVLFLRLCRSTAIMAVRSSTARAGRVQVVRSETLQPPPAGIRKEVINSLPVFQFASFPAGSSAGAECAVCLAGFEDADLLRVLPKCRHAFHMGCVDKWLEGHESCPVCRQSVEAQDILSLDISPRDSNTKQDDSGHAPAAVSGSEHRITVS